MAEYSFLWDGTTTGDAIDNAPYDRELFNQWFSFGTNSAQNKYGSVVPEYLDDLEIQVFGSSAYNALVVKAGAALIKDYIYINTQDVIFLVPSPNEGEYSTASDSDRRFDSLVLRLTYADQTVRLAYIEGVPDTDPQYPSLTQNDDIFEVYLAQIYVDKTLYTLTQSRLIDRRKFISTNKHPYTKAQNLHKNTELFGWSESIASLYVNPPENWTQVGSIVQHSPVGMLYPMVRGELYRLIVTAANATPANYIYTKMLVPKGQKTFSLLCIVYDINYVGTVGVFDVSGIRTNGETTTKNFIVGNIGSSFSNKQPYWKTFTFEEDDIEHLIVKAYIESTPAIAGNVSTNFGTLIVSPGYHPGHIRIFPETIMFKNTLKDALWSNTAKSTGSTTITFGGGGGLRFDVINQWYASAIICRVKARDSASGASATPYVELRDTNGIVYGRLHLNYVPNNYYRETIITVPINRPNIAGTSLENGFIIYVAATGAATCDVTVEIIGIIT